MRDGRSATPRLPANITVCEGQLDANQRGRSVGQAWRSGYTAIGTVCNVAARLCAEAKDGQILISQRVAARLDDNITLEDIGSLTLKGLMQPVSAFNVPLAATPPALRVIEGGPQSV